MSKQGHERRHIVLPANLTSVRKARAWARDIVTEWNVPGLIDDAQLAISELVTNAVRHAGTDVVMTLTLDDKLIVEVEDSDPELRHPAVPTTDPLATSGRGLQIVSAVSVDWGVRSVPNGKVVWFALALPDTERTDADVFQLSGRREEHERAEQRRADASRERKEDREMQARAAR
jgi:anti-sigma regulatory factor (Ser/Thr protein kinase)